MILEILRKKRAPLFLVLPLLLPRGLLQPAGAAAGAAMQVLHAKRGGLLDSTLKPVEARPMAIPRANTTPR